MSAENLPNQPDDSPANGDCRPAPCSLLDAIDEALDFMSVMAKDGYPVISEASLARLDQEAGTLRARKLKRKSKRLARKALRRSPVLFKAND